MSLTTPLVSLANQSFTFRGSELKLRETTPDTMRFLLFPVCLLLIIFVTPLNSQSDPALTLEPYTFTAQSGETVAAELGAFEVPENRTKADSRKLTLRFIRFKATTPNPGPPIVYLAGGPGGSGVNAAKGPRYPLFMALREVADVIAFEQRGTGLSDGPPDYNGLWLAPFDAPIDRDRQDAIITTATRKAAQYYADQGTDLSGYNSNESADDLNDLRRALGEDKLSLWAISYGTHLALTTLKRHEDKLHRMVIAGVEGYDHTVKLPADQQRLLERIDRMLKTDERTAAVYPDFLGDIKTVLDRVSNHPATIKGVNPVTRQPVEVTLGKHELQVLIAASLRGPASFKGLPLLLQQMKNGDFSGFSEWAAYTKSGRFRGMSMAMDLASGISQERLKMVEKQATGTLLGDAINYPYLVLYRALPELDAGKDFRAPYTSGLPVLAISGTLDGRTPPENAEETLKYLPNGSHLIIDGAGHSDPLFLSSPRILEVMMQFLQGEPVENETIVLPPVRFDLPGE